MRFLIRPRGIRILATLLTAVVLMFWLEACVRDLAVDSDA